MERHVLIVAEKPHAAKRIAEALDKNGAPEALRMKGVPYYKAERDGKIVVVSALGHLYTVAAAKRKGKRSFPAFDLKWLPKHEVRREGKRTKLWIETIAKLATQADIYVDACDYDMEGSLIGYNILNYACGKADVAKRMKYSTLTKSELLHAFRSLLPNLDYPLVEAGKARHEVDWLYGINLSRALTAAVKRVSGKYVALSTGRVQGPTLRFAVTREDEISSFVPTPYWVVKAQFEHDSKTYWAEYEKDKIKRKSEAEKIVEVCSKASGRVAGIERKESIQSPPTPFNLGDLQNEAYRYFKYSPRKTSNVAETLYLEALVSYPRTDSQKLPARIGYRSICERLSKNSKHKKVALEILSRGVLRPKEGERRDPAHPAIYPTGSLPERRLITSELRLWDLIVKRFFAVFGEPAKRLGVRVEILIGDYRFFLSGCEIVKEGWMRFYRPYVSLRARKLPDFESGDKVQLRNVVLEERSTNPPPRYHPASLLRKMEREGIGTKATRGEIIQALYDRGYVTGRTIRVTPLGTAITKALREAAPVAVSVGLTRELEEKIGDIRSGDAVREDVVAQAITRIKTILEELENRADAIGQELAEAIQKSRLDARTVGKCPTCKTGKLVILSSRKTGKRFIGCSNYFKGKCTTSFPLPQYGSVKPSGKTCRTCKWPTVIVFKRSKRPWKLCLNSACPLKERVKRG